MSAPSFSLPEVPFDVNTTLGPTLIGFALAAILYGISNVQIYLYYRRSSDDHWLMKVMISLLWTLDTAHVVFFAMTAYFFCVTNYMNPAALLVVPWDLKASYIVCIVSDSIIIGIYTWRIWKLGNKYIWLIIAIEIIGQLMNYAFGLAYVGLASKTNLLKLNARYGWVFYVEFSAKAFGDILIAASLCLTLWKLRTGIHRTDSLIRVLMVYSINTCALTSIVTIGCMIALVISPHTLVYIAVSVVQPKIVFNSMMAFLNSRRSFRMAIDNHGPLSVHLSKMRFTGPEPVICGGPSQSLITSGSENKIEIVNTTIGSIVEESASTKHPADEV